MQRSKVTNNWKHKRNTYAFIGPINSIDSPYVDGVSITHGASGSRQHVWTFAASYGPGFCPCSYGQSIPTFVGQDYFCETGNDDNVLMYKKWFINDPLWDGQDCGGYSSACERTFNSLPGSASSCPRPQLTILKSVFAQMNVLAMGIQQWKLLNSTFNDESRVVVMTAG